MLGYLRAAVQVNQDYFGLPGQVGAVQSLTKMCSSSVSYDDYKCVELFEHIVNFISLWLNDASPVSLSNWTNCSGTLFLIAKARFCLHSLKNHGVIAWFSRKKKVGGRPQCFRSTSRAEKTCEYPSPFAPISGAALHSCFHFLSTRYCWKWMDGSLSKTTNCTILS